MDVPRLHPDMIEDVKQRVDIVDVIADYVVLKKRGKDYVGLCPFHDEKTPSFSVSPGKQMYYCFGCGEGGNAIKFLMELGKRSFSDIILDLAKTYQVPIKTLEPEQRQELQRQLSLKEQLYEILAVAASFYQHALYQSQGEPALEYLRSVRHLKDETSTQFQLGYAPAGWETLRRYLVEQKRYPIAAVEEAGLIVPRKTGSGYYDRFRDRLMIPILDSQGRVIGFGGRSLAGEEPKYLNSPETTLFDKGKTLFALDKAKKSISALDKAIVVEGYFDAIALHSLGITNAVASLGTAFSESQLRQLLRYSDSKQVIFNFDADAAGIKATQRAIAEIESLVYSGQVQLRVLNLPAGKDADEFLQASADAGQTYQQLIETAPLWIDWQIQQIVSNCDLKSADQFQQVAQNITKLLAKVVNNDLRTFYISHCAEILSQGNAQLISIYAQRLSREINQPNLATEKSSRKPPKKASFTLPINSENSILKRAEATLLRIYIHYPEYRQDIIELLETKDLVFSLKEHRYLWQIILNVQAQNPHLLEESRAVARRNVTSEEDSVNELLSSLQDQVLDTPELQSQIKYFIYIPETMTSTMVNGSNKDETERTEQIQWEDPQRIPLVIEVNIATLEQILWENYQRHCIEKWQALNPITEKEKMQYYYQEFRQAQQNILELEKLRTGQFKSLI